MLHIHKYICEHCGKACERACKSKTSPRFCNRSCSNAWQHAHGMRRAWCGDKTCREWRIKKYGEEFVKKEEEEKLAQQRCELTCEQCKSVFIRYRNKVNKLPRFCSPKCANTWSLAHGRKMPSNAGNKHTEETRAKMRRAAHNRMIKNPEKENGWKSIKGWYKGYFFRSSYEYYFMKQLEREGLDIHNDVKLETLRIEYVIDGNIHIYIPDFYVAKRQTVYEIKNSYTATFDVTLAKQDAAIKELIQREIKYEIITEKQIQMPPPRKRIDDMRSDHCVFLLKDAEPELSGRLTEMFNEQDRFMKVLQEKRNFPKYPVDLSTKDGQKFVKDIAHDCMHELFEAIHLLRDAKMHRQTIVGGFDRAAFLEELADTMHYFVELLILVGVSSDEFFKAYMKKSTINFDRILSNY
jgi:hypothetical protein